MESMTHPQFAHLLVPLDGSLLAEAALPAAVALGQRTAARTTLLHVLERRAPATVHGQRHLTDVTEAEAYLAEVAAGFAAAGVAVDWHVHPNPEGDVAAAIAAHAAEFGVDLIVLCAHGQGGTAGTLASPLRAGLRVWLTGSIAQQVIRRATPPVLLVRPDESSEAPPFAPATVVVALDGTAEGEAALPAAIALARPFGAALDLVVAVETLGTVTGDRAATATLVPSATAAALDLEERAAAAYLAALRDRLVSAGLRIRTEVARGEPVRMVTAVAERVGPHVLALATHGRTGLDALWLGSVGTRVVARAAGPLLLVHPRRSDNPE
jgi:nucleotide-binding universal stress UspA family protein